MGSLTQEQKQLLFDHCMGVATEQQDAEAELLISSDPEAASFYYEQLKILLSPLESLECEPCPNSLAESTVRMLTERSHGGHSSQTKKPLVPVQVPAAGIESESIQSQPIRLSAWRSPVQIAAVAAILLFLISVAVPSLGMVREKMRQSQCQARLGQVFNGVTNYVSDYDRTPMVSTVSGDPWWKVGYQGNENHSNTRSVWLLVKDGYVQADSFLCPGRDSKLDSELRNMQLDSLQDFPGKQYINYSFRVGCGQDSAQRPGSDALMADQNPLTEQLPTDYSKPFILRLNDSLLSTNSINHNRRGQNVMLRDGSVQFVRTRTVGQNQDDIYMLQDMNSGTEIKGCEVPSCETDAFLAP